VKRASQSKGIPSSPNPRRNHPVPPSFILKRKIMKDLKGKIALVTVAAMGMTTCNDSWKGRSCSK
jgi:hypothetical protein